MRKIISTTFVTLDAVKNILEHKGEIKRFADTRIPEETQREYLKILNDFEGSKNNQ